MCSFGVLIFYTIIFKLAIPVSHQIFIACVPITTCHAGFITDSRMNKVHISTDSWLLPTSLLQESPQM